MMFRCDFGKGVTCEMEIGDEPPTKGTSHILEIQWTGKPTIKTLRLYKAWMNSVNEMLADKWGFKFMHVFMLQKGRNECWVYEPGQRPRCSKIFYGQTE